MASKTSTTKKKSAATKAADEATTSPTEKVEDGTVVDDAAPSGAASDTAPPADTRLGGRQAYVTPARHHQRLLRSGLRLKNAISAKHEAEEAMYNKVVEALLDGVKPSAIQRSLGVNRTMVQRMLERARSESYPV